MTVTIYDLEEKEKKPDDKDKRNEKGIHREEKDCLLYTSDRKKAEQLQ